MNNWTLLVNLTLKSTLVLALAWLVALALRRRSAAARHIVWTAAFAALLALPLLSFRCPPGRIRLQTPSFRRIPASHSTH